MTIAPNFNAFRDAQRRLRENFGRPITFYAPGTAAAWASGTQLDPETGLPFDPTIDPESGGDEVTTVVSCNVVSRPMGLSQRGIDDSTKQKAIGFMEQGGIVVIVDIEDWHLVSSATELDYADERYKVTQTDHDYLGPVERYLIWARQF